MTREPKAVKRLRRKLTIENLWIYIIGVLKNEPTYAYNIRVKIREKYGFKPATMTLYTVLYRMKREGLITTIEADGTKLYTVTDKGLKAYNKAIQILENMINMLKS